MSMIVVIEAAKVFTNTSAAVIAMVFTLIADAIPPVVSEKLLIDMKTALSVGGTVFVATWWLSRKFQNIEDRLKSAELAREKMQGDLKELIQDHQQAVRRR